MLGLKGNFLSFRVESNGRGDAILKGVGFKVGEGRSV